MKRVLLIIAILHTLAPCITAQDVGGDVLFRKTVENNFINDVIVELPDREDGMYNLRSKSATEMRFFGDFNAKVEFFVAPSFDPSAGFRVRQDSLNNTYRLEIKFFPVKNKQTEATTGEISVQTVKISKEFVDKLHDRVLSLISTARAVGKPRNSFDGTDVTFRCVVDDQVWTFTTKNSRPESGVANLTDICTQIISDLRNNDFEESRYFDSN